LTGALVADDSLAVLEGRVDQTLAAGDHLLVVIAVLDSVVGPATEPGLLYQRRGYGRATR
jgi:flavin reductase (DIM6/NTAB) family NADH-FMN oxidoreductase RutF